jgi:hypothetical protein
VTQNKAATGQITAHDGKFWLGSIAMNKKGEIALGYSKSSSSVYPSVNYTNRLVTDPLNTMRVEATLKTGTGSQTIFYGRWGDYSMMSVDPTDDCTFWYTNEYLATTGSVSWRTRIGKFRAGTCP